MMNKKLITIMATTMPILAMAQTSNITYPKTVKGNVVDTYFGEKVSDPYRWLENDTSDATAKWVAAENKVTADYLGKLPYRAPLLKRMTELVNYERSGAPFKEHGRYYFYKNNGLQNQSVLYVQNSLTDEPRVFLDPNTLSTDGTVALKGVYFSHNGKYAAYVISRSGSDWQEIYLLDAATGKPLGDHIKWAKFTDASWMGDGFYYSAYDAPVKGKEFSNVNENHKIYYHKVGTPQSEDVLFYQNKKYPKHFYGVQTTKDENMIFLSESGDGAGNALYVKDARKKNSKFKTMSASQLSQHSVIDVIGDSIYLFTYDGASKGRIMVADINNPDFADWLSLVPESDNVLKDASIIDHKLVLTYSKDACDHAYVYSLDGRREYEVAMPSVGSVSFSGDKDESDCFFTFSSFTVPGTVYKFDVSKNTYTEYVKPKLAFNTDDFVTKQIFFTSKDGTRVPMFLTYKKGINLDGTNPTLIYGYGGFNISLGPSFSTSRIPFIENGGIYVMVNLRGGNEYGEAWHEAGTKMNKQNVFDDFISAAEYLIKNNYTSSKHIVIQGGSNGGLLVGACMTQRPDLYRVAIAQVGVMDMLRYHKFTIGWNWASDYGTSADSKEMFEYLRNYSPLHNIKKNVKYPATLVTTADHDDRVVPAHSFKFAATLQECNDGTNPTLIRIDSKAGHGGGKPIAKQLEETADIYSFIYENLGMKME